MKAKFKVGAVVYNLITNSNEEITIFKSIVQKVFYNQKDGFSYALNDFGKTDKKFRYKEKELYLEREIIDEFNSFIDLV